jgi:predicted alpha/beta-fold hydrolase
MTYAPSPWLRGGHAQTVFARLWSWPPGPAPRRERWETPDGDFLDVDRHGDPAGPTAVVLHGLEGSSRAPYVRRLVRQLLREGLSAAAVNFRGCSGEENRLPRLYHSGETGDLDFAVRRLAAERPGRRLGVAGFSLGGNVAAKWLGERGDDLPDEVRAGAVISVPFDLAASAEALDGPGFWPVVYRERFLRMLRRKALAKAHRFPGLLDPAAVRAARSFREFDDRATAPLHGFAGARDYWSRASAARFVSGVRRPLLALAAADDPMVPAAALPLAAAQDNPSVELRVLPGGGHVGFVAGPPWAFRFWAERRAATFLAAHLR